MHRPDDATVRCFVALLPDAAARDALDRLGACWHRRFPACRRVPADNLHLTLAFIGAIAPEVARRIADALAATPPAAIAVALDAIDAFAGARVLVAGCAAPPPQHAPLMRAAAQARALLESLNVPFDRKPFVPHVTLLRQLARRDAAQARAPLEPPLQWQATRPLLLQSCATPQAVRYLPIEPAASRINAG